MIDEVPLSSFGLETVASACERKNWKPRSMENWIHDGLLKAVPVGKGRGARFLVFIDQVDTFEPPKRGPAPKKKAAAKRGKKSK